MPVSSGRVDVNKKWDVVRTGGWWEILTVDDDVVAAEVPYAEVADHIAEIHNKWLEEQ